MKTVNCIPVLLSTLTLLSFTLLSSSSISADDSIVDNINITVPASCSLFGTGQNSHNATIVNGTYEEDIGTTTLKAFCNDNEGFAIYATGYTGNEIGATNSNKLVGTSASNNAVIDTGTNTSASNPDISNWAMKLATNTSATYQITLDNNFNNYHVVPNEYTKVAHRNSGTDIGTSAEGATLTTTYAAYISKTQPADTYTGQVIYTLVHPSDMPTPKSTMLDIGQVVNAKMKTLAAGTSTAYNAKTSDIKAIRIADELPVGFIPSETNTVSTSDSKHPIYIFYDNTDDAGIIYFYTGGYQVVMNPDSSHMFRSNLALTDISGLSSWDTSNVINARSMFTDSVINLVNLDALSSWNTSKIEDLSFAFAVNTSTISAGYHSKLTDISGLINWNTSNITTIASIFQNNENISNLRGLEFWDTSKVENMQYAFGCGTKCDMLIKDISSLTNWDTGNVTSMNAIFNNNSILTDFSPLANWDTSKVEDMSAMFNINESAGINNFITDLSPFTEWNVSNVTNMSKMFQNRNIASFLPLRSWSVSKVQDFSNAFNQTDESTTTTLAGLEDWNVSSVTNMGSMFADSVSLTDASAINGWDVRNVVIKTGTESVDEGFNRMFSKSPVHPTFLLRPGTWNNSGTFIPSS